MFLKVFTCQNVLPQTGSWLELRQARKQKGRRNLWANKSHLSNCSLLVWVMSINSCYVHILIGFLCCATPLGSLSQPSLSSQQGQELGLSWD